MRRSRLGDFLLGAGAVVGLAAVVGLVVGFEPAKLPAAVINLAVYKLTFVGAAGLLLGGALVHRYARRGEHPIANEARREATTSPQAALADGAANPPASTLHDEQSRARTREDR